MPSPALAMVTDQSYPPDGRIVQVLAADGCDLEGIRAVKSQLLESGVAVHVVATHKGAIAGANAGDEMTVDRSFLTADSVEADALVVADGTNLAGEPSVLAYLQEAYRHHKTIGAWGDGETVLRQAAIPTDLVGIATSASADAALVGSIIEGLGRHRHWERAADMLAPATVS